MKAVKVSQVNNYISRVLANDPILANLSVTGEVSNLKFHGSGHVYFSLKDESSKINCFLPAGNFSRMSGPLEDGMEIIASGYISVYQRGGYYSLNVKDIETAGEGQLAARFERLKAQLEKEGLFSSEKKKELPFFPKRIAIVTSESGAAVRDIIKTIKNKNNYVDILICPVLVQGPSAPADIAEMIKKLNREYSDIDLIITGRGGGSIEELWAFNDEDLARTIFSSKIPIISAVGHETDFTIADFVADVRAATPTAAAEMAVPDINEIRSYIDYVREMLDNELKNSVSRKRDKLLTLNPKSFSSGIRSRIAYEQVNIERLMESSAAVVKSRTEFARKTVEMLGNLVQSSSPDAILARGYSVVTDSEGQIVRDTSSLAAGRKIHVRAASGSAEAVVTEVFRS